VIWMLSQLCCKSGSGDADSLFAMYAYQSLAGCMAHLSWHKDVSYPRKPRNIVTSTMYNVPLPILVESGNPPPPPPPISSQ
jgi:hypothetical protein